MLKKNNIGIVNTRGEVSTWRGLTGCRKKRRRREARPARRFGGQLCPTSLRLPGASQLSFPQCLSHLKKSRPTYLSHPQSSKLLCSIRSTCPTRVNLTFSCVLAEVGEGHCPLLNLTQAPQPHGLNPYNLAGRTGTKQLLFCQTPLDKCSTFNNKLCKPNTKQFLASKRCSFL